MKKQIQQNAYDLMMLSEAICTLKGATKNYFNHNPELTFEKKNTLKQLFYDIAEFCQALYED